MSKSFPAWALSATLLCVPTVVRGQSSTSPADTSQAPMINLYPVQVDADFLSFVNLQRFNNGNHRFAEPNTTSIGTVDFKLGQVTFEFIGRSDWINSGQQYEGLLAANAKVALTHSSYGDISIQAGSFEYVGPQGSRPNFLQTSNYLRNDLGIGGPDPGMFGLLVTDNYKDINVDAKITGLAGTGDRGLTGSLIGNQFNSLCQRKDHRACGVTEGLIADVVINNTPLTLHGLLMNIANGGQLRDELRMSFGFDWKRNFGNYTATLSPEFDHVANYLGGNKPLDIASSTFKVDRPIREKTVVTGYTTLQEDRGAMHTTYAFAGVALTYNLTKSDFVKVEIYGGAENPGRNAQPLYGGVFTQNWAF